MSKVMHGATIEPATESDNQEWAYIFCDSSEKLDDPIYSSDWRAITCKRCLKWKPKGENQIDGISNEGAV